MTAGFVPMNIGWRMSGIGVYQDSCGGDIEYRYIIVMTVTK